MSDVQLKCPSCGAPINFDVSSGKMQCGYCTATFTVEEVNQFNGIAQANAELAMAHEQQTGGAAARTLAWQGAATIPNPGGGQMGTVPSAEETGWVEPPPTYLDESTGQQMAQFQCNSCGGEIIGSPDMVSSKCPWCNNNFVATGQLTRTRVPDRMIPFGMTKEQALAAFKEKMKGLKLLPRAFTRAKLDDIQGVYVPYWLYDASVSGQAVFEGSRTRTWIAGDTEYTEHNVYTVSRACRVDYLDVPVAGTSKITANITESIEPFDYSKSTAFSPAYLTGFMTNKYDVEAEQANPRALERMKDSTIATMRDSVLGFDSVQEISSSVAPTFGALEYVFLPLWLMNISWDGKNYNYAMNGQTGKFVGEFPVSKAKFWGGFAAIAVSLFAILGGLFVPFLMPLLMN